MYILVRESGCVGSGGSDVTVGVYSTETLAKAAAQAYEGDTRQLEWKTENGVTSSSYSFHHGDCGTGYGIAAYAVDAPLAAPVEAK